MIARFNYSSPLGKIGMQADEYGITEVKFIDQSKENNLNPTYPPIKDAVKWLFPGKYSFNISLVPFERHRISTKSLATIKTDSLWDNSDLWATSSEN